MPEMPGNGPQTLPTLEQLRHKALSQAERRGKIVAVRRTFLRGVWDALWGMVLPSIGLFFCVLLAGYGGAVALGYWSWHGPMTVQGPESASPASPALTPPPALKPSDTVPNPP